MRVHHPRRHLAVEVEFVGPLERCAARGSGGVVSKKDRQHEVEYARTTHRTQNTHESDADSMALVNHVNSVNARVRVCVCAAVMVR
jgi:hypothetical protein